MKDDIRGTTYSGCLAAPGQENTGLLCYQEGTKIADETSEASCDRRGLLKVLA